MGEERLVTDLTWADRSHPRVPSQHAHCRAGGAPGHTADGVCHAYIEAGAPQVQKARG